MLFSHLKVTIHAQGQAPRSRTLRLFTRGKLLHCQRLRPIDGLKKPETLGIPTASRGKPVCKGPTVKPTEVIKNLFTISKITPASRSWTGIRLRDLNFLAVSPSHQDFSSNIGGGGRNRTDDLLLAKQMLSQLSYAPR